MENKRHSPPESKGKHTNDHTSGHTNNHTNDHSGDHTLENFLEMMAAERGVSANTIEAYRRDLEKLEMYISQNHETSLRQATPQQLKDYFTFQSQEGMTAKSSARHLSSFRQYFKFLLVENKRADDPTTYLDAPKQGRRLPKVLDEKEVIALLEAISRDKEEDQRRLVALMEILYASGLRVSELVSLPLSAISRDGQYLTVTGKGNKERILPLTNHSMDAIKAYLEVRGAYINKSAKSGEKSAKYLFPSRGKQGHLTRQRFGQLLKQVAIEANLDPKRISPHVLRHAFATHLLDNGADLISVQNLLGHSDVSTTQIYTHVMTHKMQELVFKKHPLANKE
ncbi:MAG: site-specific tyrosine recombinase XerD [Alphaproteobacteria bacterium]|jgi:integrase/recombinase XerD|nr:site-specific tyrosine recombinase XerD [Alphaproteobacteria bacterium]MBT5389921.1 site-specific tyrosine recombinase XerD [Alphaproteobacteria bacterium]MBT5540390.1 site-specific tyrosine recombinase XerD [Alphaproteobacteria bacterium]MBT5654398.1 site-specific tyrosine recombinase XerD [Alphaproteobacteria bacterium]